jgi:hypothetical protein
MPASISGAVARKSLGVIRIGFGAAALVVPHFLVKNFQAKPEGPEASRDKAIAAQYAFRLFGIRTVIIGFELLLLKGAALERAANLAPIIHGSDTISAFIAAKYGPLPKRMGIILVAIPAVNTGLSVLARRR